MDYQKFKLDYDQSGLTQAQYGKKVGKSASMVSYYLKRARSEQVGQQTTSFSKLEVLGHHDRMIRIKTSSGVVVEIPL